LSEHALKMSTQMTKPISRRSKKGLEPEVAANVLVSVAGYAILARRRGVGEELLLAALKLAPQHEGALLSLAASREQLGRYREAIDALEKLVGAYRTHREGRLRLAVNLERLGQTDEALDVYRSLENDGRRDWVELVATQQIVAILAAQGLLDQAASSLTLAIERWPSEPALRIQLAWVLDESGRLDIAGEMVEEILTTSGSASESARYRYNHWYSYVFDESRQTLAELVQQQAVEFEQPSNQGPPSR
jgi:tetratricopeptide (TPR) repeat protein